MRLIKFSFIAAGLGVCFFALSYGAASRLEQAKSFSYPESIARHYAQVSGKVFEGGTFGSDSPTEFKKSLALDPAVEVDSLDVETTAVDVEFLPSENDSIEVSLSSTHVDPREPVLIDANRGRTIHIATQEGNAQGIGRNGWMNFNFDLGDGDEPRRKNVLQIRVPKSIARAQIRTTSGNALLASALKSVTFQSKSGDARIATADNPLARVEALTIETISGNLKGPGRFDHLQFNSVSGDVDISSLDRVLDINGHSVSGNLKIRTTEALDVDVSFSSKSGRVKIAKEFGLPPGTADNSIFKLGKGTTRLSFQTVSGDLTFKRVTGAPAGDDDEETDDSSSDEGDTEASRAAPAPRDVATVRSIASARASANSGYLGCVARLAVRSSSRMGAVSTGRCVRFFAQI